MDLDLGILIFKSFFEVLTILEVDNKNLHFLKELARDVS